MIGNSAGSCQPDKMRPINFDFVTFAWMLVWHGEQTAKQFGDVWFLNRRDWR